MKTDAPGALQVKWLGCQEYEPTLQAMQDFTQSRGADAPDELWFLSHPPVYTQGQAGRPEHVLNPGSIPVIQIDRGGQVTYHGPGQLVVYLLIDLRRRGLGIRELVDLIEDSILAVLAGLGIDAEKRHGAPGVYVKNAKIAALGLRVRRGCSYHGLSLNVDMDLEPFSRINPCGYAGMAVTQVADLLEVADPFKAASRLMHDELLNRLSATEAQRQERIPRRNATATRTGQETRP